MMLILDVVDEDPGYQLQMKALYLLSWKHQNGMGNEYCSGLQYQQQQQQKKTMIDEHTQLVFVNFLKEDWYEDPTLGQIEGGYLGLHQSEM
jgi:hypothetical protein